MRTLAFVILMLALVGWAADPPVSPYRRGIAAWRAQQEAALKADDGWLTVVGLVWLKEGVNRVGSNSAFEVRLPKAAPDKVGTLTLKAGSVRFRPEKGVPVMLNGAAAVETELKPDIAPRYDTLAVGRIRLLILQREQRFGVRIKDNDSAARRQFTGLRWYPVDESWNVRARYIPYNHPRKFMFDTLAGVKEEAEAPGYVTFERAGKEYRMEPVADGADFWFVMRDETSGKTTYGASRFLYAPPPKTGLRQKGVFEIDFNKAENPPCAFTDYATCPLPPPQNRLPVAVTAGELMYGKQH